MKMRSPVVAAVSIAVGLVVLLGYFLPLPFVQNVRTLLINWGVSLAGVAALIGILNLLLVHWRKAGRKENNNPYSVLLLLAFLITFAAGVWLTPADLGFQHVITSIQVPVETSLMALLAITLGYAGLRLLQRRKEIMGVLFVISAIIFLLFLSGFLPVVQQLPLVGGVASLFSRLPIAGARGILLGIAIGSLITGLRIFLGADRPYNG